MMNSELVFRLQSGDRDALGDVRRIYGGTIYRNALRVVRDHWDAEEVVQDVLWTVFRKVRSLTKAATFEAWLFRITRNASLMLLRRRKRAPIPVEESVVERSLQSTTSEDPAGRLTQRRALERAQNAFDNMEPQSQWVYYQVDVEGRTRLDVAGELNISEAALKSRLHRARVLVREAVASAGV